MITNREACIFIGSLGFSCALFFPESEIIEKYCLLALGTFCLLYLFFTKPNYRIQENPAPTKKSILMKGGSEA